jgi:hypothetical protein
VIPKAVIQTLMIVSLGVSCGTLIRSRSLAQAGPVQRNPVVSTKSGDTEPISDEEYAVFSDLFRMPPPQSAEGKSRELLVIGTETVGPAMDEVRRDAACEQDFPAGQPPARLGPYLLSVELRPLVDDLLIKNRKTYVFSPRFNLLRPYALLRNSDFNSLWHGSEGGNAFYKQKPGADGFKTLSRVGFNSQKTVALVYVESYYTFLDTFTTFVLLKKSASKWTRIEAYSCATWRAGIKPEVP